MTDTVIRADKLVKYYKKSKVAAIDKLSLDIKQGGIFTLLGRNGAGKTTFLRIATTQLLPTSGVVEVFGRDVVHDARSICRRIAITPQEGRPLFTLNATDHIILSLMMRGLSHGEASSRAEKIIKTLELEDVARVHSEELSGGLKQRILIAMTLATDVELMFLDEPTIGLDPVNRRKVWDELIRLKNEQGKTIVLTTHYMDEAESLSDELAIVDRGRVLAKGTAQEVRERNLTSRTRVDISKGFTLEELQSYGKTSKAGNLYRVFANELVAQEISREALRRKVPVSISPVTLDDVFIELVGSELDEEEASNEDRDQREVLVK